MIMDYPQKVSTNYYLKQSGIDYPKDGLRFYDVRNAPFAIYGLMDYEDGKPFRRMPWEIAYNASKDVYCRHTQTSGGRVRFATDSDKIAIDVRFPALEDRPMLTLTANSGFDLCVIENGKEQFVHSYEPAIDAVDGYTTIFKFQDRKLRELTLYFPLYQDVSDLKIGLAEDAVVAEAAGYTIKKPLLFYGSSITQGASACRPSLSFAALIARRFDADFINLGFASGCKAEPEMLEYLKTVKSSVYILDYDHNSPNPEYLEKTHYAAYKSYRDVNPDTPIILVTRGSCTPDAPDIVARREVIRNTYTRAKKDGDEKVWFVDGSQFFATEDPYECTIDSVHPNDLGHHRMAKFIGQTVAIALENA